MVLADTSVWIGHFRGRRPCRNLHAAILPQRARVLQDLSALPLATAARDSEVLRVIEHFRLWGKADRLGAIVELRTLNTR